MTEFIYGGVFQGKYDRQNSGGVNCEFSQGKDYSDGSTYGVVPKTEIQNKQQQQQKLKR